MYVLKPLSVNWSLKHYPVAEFLSNKYQRFYFSGQATTYIFRLGSELSQQAMVLARASYL